MKVGGPWLERAPTQAVLAMLARVGHRALVVGGCVRNAILGEPVADVDIATDAPPDRVAGLARDAGLKAVPTGIAHGTVTVIAEGVAHEVTTFRRDVATFGRHAQVSFSDRIEEDAARRDFTMNALYATAGGEVIDPLGGLADTLARRVRFVGAPEDRIREDYLRILRFFRFLAWYGEPSEAPDAQGLAACAALVHGLDTLSRERVGAEITRLLAAPDPVPALAAMEGAGVLARVLPGAGLKHVRALVALERGLAPSFPRRLAALGGEDPARRLRLSRAEAALLRSLREAAGGQESPAALGHQLGEGAGRDAVLLRAAIGGTAPPAGWQDELARGARARFPVTAGDLMPALSGPALGRRLEMLRRRWLDGGLRAGREELLAQDFNS